MERLGQRDAYVILLLIAKKSFLRIELNTAVGSASAANNFEEETWILNARG